MALDLAKTALQIDSMTLAIDGRSDQVLERVINAVSAMKRLDPQVYAKKTQDSEGMFKWGTPAILEEPGKTFPPPKVPVEHKVIGVDGSHIDVDRHIPAHCYLINTGLVSLNYGPTPSVVMRNDPSLYFESEETFITDLHGSTDSMKITGSLLGAVRTVKEIDILRDAITDGNDDIPVVGLMDGTLIMLDLIRAGFPDYVLKQVLQGGFLSAMSDIRDLSKDKPLAIGSYISLPGTSEVVDALRLSVCPYTVSDCASHCASVSASHRPCDEVSHEILDRQIFEHHLPHGHRSPIFGSSSRMVEKFYGGNLVGFFYVNVGEEIARIEVPEWVYTDKEKIDLIHAVILNQCMLGPGYPTALMEAHEQAVISTSDRLFFLNSIEGAFESQGVKFYTSQKNRSKRLRWL